MPETLRYFGSAVNPLPLAPLIGSLKNQVTSLAGQYHKLGRTIWDPGFTVLDPDAEPTLNNMGFRRIWSA